MDRHNSHQIFFFQFFLREDSNFPYTFQHVLGAMAPARTQQLRARVGWGGGEGVWGWTGVSWGGG